MDRFEKIVKIVTGLNKKYPEGQDPFRIITRLCEESGELASEVNRMESIGSKIKKRGPPDRLELAKEAQDVIRCAIALLVHYDLFEEFDESLASALSLLKKDGFTD